MDRKEMSFQLVWDTKLILYSMQSLFIFVYTTHCNFTLKMCVEHYSIEGWGLGKAQLNIPICHQPDKWKCQPFFCMKSTFYTLGCLHEDSNAFWSAFELCRYIKAFAAAASRTNKKQSYRENNQICIQIQYLELSSISASVPRSGLSFPLLYLSISAY